MAEQIANLATAQERFSRLTLKELRHVLLLQQTLSFNRAAELAGVSQSALSQSIARIEKRRNGVCGADRGAGGIGAERAG